jgi:hypothetical protein
VVGRRHLRDCEEGGLYIVCYAIENARNFYFFFFDQFLFLLVVLGTFDGWQTSQLEIYLMVLLFYFEMIILISKFALTFLECGTK